MEGQISSNVSPVFPSVCGQTNNHQTEALGRRKKSGFSFWSHKGTQKMSYTIQEEVSIA